MKQIVGNIFDILDADAICVTTCGVTKANGELVMGKGIALSFKERYPLLSRHLGGLVKAYGNHVHGYRAFKPVIVSFPTKNDWKDPSPISLVVQSAKELYRLTNSEDWTKVVLPRPGTGLGGLDWETQVKPALELVFDDRFYIITPENN